ncbi:MAG: TetR/AcrR family transcriptional regulator [Streptosporangiales bacterium]|nr:TetR/AcrR family transcriptional regulator [Streptosporangiales bacterium]
MSQTSPAEPARRSRSATSGARKNSRGETTRQLILTAAERLFAERGISAVPLRDIGLAAGQRNHTAVRYHFGERDEVVRAIMEFRGAQSEAIRIGMVADLSLAGSPAIRDVVSAFVRPLAIHIQPDNHYLAFLSLYITEEGGYEGLAGVNAGASVVTLRALLGRLVPQIPAAVLDERWWLTLTSAVHALARYHSAQRKHTKPPGTVDPLIDDMVAYLSAGLSAPVSAPDGP